MSGIWNGWRTLSLTRNDCHWFHGLAKRRASKRISVANLARQDGIDFLGQVSRAGVVVKTTTYPMQQANRALADLRAGRFEGAAVLVP